MRVVAASSVDQHRFTATAFDHDTDQRIATALEHATGEYIDLHIGTQTITVAPAEVDGVITLLGWYARARDQRLRDEAEQAFETALERVGERR